MVPLSLISEQPRVGVGCVEGWLCILPMACETQEDILATATTVSGTTNKDANHAGLCCE